MLAFDRRGSGAPQLLIHANGMSRRAWSPVLDRLAARRDVIAVDLPGHGESPEVPAHVVPAPPGFAHLLCELLDELGIERAHVAGNSLGGWTALEVARLGRAESVVALGPAGLWRRGPIRPVVALSAMHRAARRGRALAPTVLGSRLGRRLLLGQALGCPEHVPPTVAVEIVDDLARASGFHQTLLATHTRRFQGGRGIEVPVTIVFGRRDRVVPQSARRGDELPRHTRWLHPSHLGHVPMWDDPALVASIILGEAPPSGLL